jgi:hypothetical protein
MVNAAYLGSHLFPSYDSLFAASVSFACGALTNKIATSLWLSHLASRPLGLLRQRLAASATNVMAVSMRLYVAQQGQQTLLSDMKYYDVVVGTEALGNLQQSRICVASLNTT